MRTAEIFHVNNNVRLMRIALTLTKDFTPRGLKVRMPKIQTDVNDEQFKKTINQTTTYYED